MMHWCKTYMLFILIWFITSCSFFRESICELNPNIDPLVDDTVYLLVEITAQKNDIFRVYYMPEGEDSFKDLGYIEKKIASSKESQTILFAFPKGVYLKKIRLDISELRQNQNFTIHRTKFFFERKCFEIKDEFSYFFMENKFIEKEKNTSYIYSTKFINNQYDPHFLSKNLIDVMDYLLYKN